jgi:hypothetical protein
MSQTTITSRCPRAPYRCTLATPILMFIAMAAPLDSKACADHAAAASSPGALRNVQPPKPVSSPFNPAHRNITDPPARREAEPAPRAQSIDESAPDPFRKSFPPARTADPRAQPLTDDVNQSMHRSIFDMPGLMNDAQRDDPRRTGKFQSPPPHQPPALDAETLGERLRQRDGAPDMR